MSGWSRERFRRPDGRDRPPGGPFSRAARNRKNLLAVAAGLLLLLFNFAACSRPASTFGGNILRVSQRNEPADLDPATASLPDEFFIIGALSEGLLVPDPAGGAPLPGAADSFDISGDGLTYTFHLRPAAVWSNGEPITAADFAESYHRLLNPATAAPKADLFFMVHNARAFATGALADFSKVGFHASNAHTLVVALERPFARFPYYVASGPWMPANPRIVARYGRTWTEPAHFVGNGPFVLTEWRGQQRIVVKKNPRYRAAGNIRLDEIDFVRFDDDDTEERAFRTGQIDVTVTVPRTKLSVYAREHPAELHHAPTAETRFLSFNTRRPALADARVRRALALAIDRARIVERITQGGQQPALRFVPAQLRPPGEAPPEGQFSHDPAEARHLLAEAGFAGGNGFPHVELVAWSHSQIPVLEVIQAMWRNELGIDVTVATREAKVLLAALATGDYDIAFVTTLALLDVNDPVALLDNFTADGANNFPHWQSAEYDRLLAAARTERDAPRLAAELARAESLLLTAAPVAPLYFNARNWLMSPRVHGWHEDALWTRSYRKISVDEN